MELDANAIESLALRSCMAGNVYSSYMLCATTIKCYLSRKWHLVRRRLDCMYLQQKSLLPGSRARPFLKSPQPATHPNRPEKRLQQLVLIVDDTPEVRQSLRAELERSGYRVLEASADDEALEIMANERVEVLLLDLVMPGLNGLELLREMRRQALPSLQTIALTGAKPLDTKLRPLFRSLGVSRFVPKSLGVGVLLEAIEGGRFTARSVAPHPKARWTRDAIQE